MTREILPVPKTPFSLSTILYDIGMLDYDEEFPPPPKDCLDKLVAQIKCGDFIRWKGYADFEYPYVYQKVVSECAIKDMHAPTFVQFIREYKEHLAKNPIYGVVSEITDTRTEEWAEKCRKCNPPVQNPMDEQDPIRVSTVSIELRGEGDSYSIMSLFEFDSLIDANPYPIQRVRTVSKQEVLNYIAGKIGFYQQRVNDALTSSDSKQRLLACIDARKQFRFAEIGVALYQSNDALTALRQHFRSAVRPETGYFVLLPASNQAFEEFGPRLVYINDENPHKLNEHKVKDFIALMVPNIFGQDKLVHTEIEYSAFGVPHRNLKLLEGIDVIEIQRPPINMVKIVTPQNKQLGQKDIETFLLERG